MSAHEDDEEVTSAEIYAYLVINILIAMVAYRYPIMVDGEPWRWQSVLLAIFISPAYFIWLAFENPITPSGVKCDAPSCTITTLLLMFFWPAYFCFAPQEYWALDTMYSPA